MKTPRLLTRPTPSLRGPARSAVLCTALAAAAFGAAPALAQSTAPAASDPPAREKGQTAPPSTVPERKTLRHADEAFLKQAAEDGHTEVEGSRLALQKATDPQVKRYAQTMVDEHTRMAETLRTLARSKGVELPDRPSLLQRGKLKLLSTSEGDTFTRRYVDNIAVEAHEDTVKLFEKAAEGAGDPEVKAFAERSLPTLRKHLDMARGLKPTATGGTGPAHNDRSDRSPGTPATPSSPSSPSSPSRDSR